MAKGEGRGGTRDGAGRKEGAVTVKTREVAERIVQDGDITMLDIMVENARYFRQQALDAEAALAKMQPDVLAAIEDPQDQFNRMLAEVKKAAGLRERAQSCAEGAAPFLHARLAAVTIKGDKKNPLHMELNPRDFIERQIEAIAGRAVGDADDSTTKNNPRRPE